MRLQQFVPYLLVDDVAATSAFYVAHLGFESAMALDWFVSLAHRERPEYKLDFVRRDHREHEVIPDAFWQRPAGVVLAFVVDDAAGAYAEFQAARVPVVLPLRDEPGASAASWCRIRRARWSSCCRSSAKPRRSLPERP